MLGREIEVARVEQLQNLHHRVHRHPACRHPAQPAVIKTLRAVGLEPVAITPERPLAHPQYLRRIGLAQLVPVPAPVNILELHKPQSL
jgi:hypothetical protein